MAITYVNGDISTNDNVAVVTGVSWTGLGHAAADYTLGIWALDQAATSVTLDTDFTQVDNDVDQNLRAILFQRDMATMTGLESGTILMSVDAATLNRMSAAIAIWRGVGSIGTLVNFTEGGTADDVHPVANNLSITPTADNALIVLVYAERSSTGNTAGTLAPPTHVGTGTPATVRRERGTGGSGGTYVQIAEFQLGAGTAGVAQTFTQWDATPDTLIASNAEMWLVPLYPLATGTAEAGVALAVGTTQAKQVKVASQSGSCSAAASVQGSPRKVAGCRGQVAAASSPAASGRKAAPTRGQTAAAASAQGRAAKRAAGTASSSTAGTGSAAHRKIAVGVARSCSAGFPYWASIVVPRAQSGTCSSAGYGRGGANKLTAGAGQAIVAGSVQARATKRATGSATAAAASCTQSSSRKRSPIAAQCTVSPTSTVSMTKTVQVAGASYALVFTGGQRRALSPITPRPDTGTTPRPDTGKTTRPDTGRTERLIILS